MPIPTRSRLAAALGAVVLLANMVSTDTTSPAAAVPPEPSLVVVNGPFTATTGWGDGIAVDGMAFEPDTDYRIEVYATRLDMVRPFGSRTIRSDRAGRLHLNHWVPAAILQDPEHGETYWIAVIPPSEDWSDATRVRLPIVKTPGISVASTTVDAAALATGSGAFWIEAAGYTIGEPVTTSATQEGIELPVTGGRGVADAETSVTLDAIAVAGARSGPLRVSVLGEQSGVRHWLTLQVTGGTPDPDDVEAPPASSSLPAPTASPQRRLPIVDG